MKAIPETRIPVAGGSSLRFDLTVDEAVSSASGVGIIETQPDMQLVAEACDGRGHQDFALHC
jgi:hypothetical protein